MENKIALFDLDQQFREIDALLESAGGDLDATANGAPLAEWLEKNEIATAQKVDGYCAVIEKIQGDIDVCKQMIDRLEDRMASFDHKAARLKLALRESMNLRQIVKIEAPMHTVWTQRSGKAPLEIIDEKLIPERFYVTKTETVLAKDLLRQAVERGEPDACAAAKIGEVSQSLRIK